MPKSGFFVSLATPDGFDADAYAEQAGLMANVFAGILGDASKIAVLTKNAPLSSCHSEVEVAQPDGKLVGRAVIEFEADQRVTLDKTRLSQMLKSAAPWKNCKVEKRALEAEILDAEPAAVA